MGTGLQQMVYKHTVIVVNIKQQNFNKGLQRENINGPFSPNDFIIVA